MHIKQFLDYTVDVVETNGEKRMAITLIRPRTGSTATFEGGLALQFTDLMSSLLSEYERKAIALDIEEGNHG